MPRSVSTLFEANRMWSEIEKLVRDKRLLLSYIAGLNVVGIIMVLPIPVIIAHTLDRIIPQGQILHLILFGCLMLMLQLVNAVVTVFRRKIVFSVSKSVVADLRGTLFEKLHSVSLNYFKTHELGHIHNRLVQDTLRVDRFFETLLSVFAPAVLTSLGLSLVLVYLSWELYLISLLFLTPIVVIHALLKPIQRKETKSYIESFSVFSDSVFSTLRRMELIRQRASDHRETRLSKMYIDHLKTVDERHNYIRTIFQTSQQTMISFASFITLTVGGIMVIREQISVGQLFAFFAGLALLRAPLSNLLTSTVTMIEGFQSLERIVQLLDDPDCTPYSGSKELAFSGTITLDNVSFSYTDQPLIKNVSMEIRPGQIMALVGSSGCGKSTLVNLIFGFERPDSGRLFADGNDYNDINLKQFRRAIGIVPQLPIIISGTIEENIAYGHDKFSDDDLKSAISSSGVDEFLNSLENGIDTKITQDGFTLSGGQRQRIAIARALLGNPRLLVLDEPTNHLDDNSIDRFMSSVAILPNRPSVLLITHRSDIHRWAKSVYVLKDGCVRPLPIGSDDQFL